MRCIEFHEKSFEEFNEWAIFNKSIYKRLVRIIEETQRTPFEGIGKPEPLKGNLAGKWSKRINDEHRLIYTATDEAIKIYSCRDHY